MVLHHYLYFLKNGRALIIKQRLSNVKYFLNQTCPMFYSVIHAQNAVIGSPFHTITDTAVIFIAVPVVVDNSQ